jgi:hypothetical protein
LVQEFTICGDLSPLLGSASCSICALSPLAHLGHFQWSLRTGLLGTFGGIPSDMSLALPYFSEAVVWDLDSAGVYIVLICPVCALAYGMAFSSISVILHVP